MVKMIQPSMAGGEVSAAVGARVDLSKRAVAVERAENFFATFTGSMASRPGQKFVAQTKRGAGPYRIIEFEFNTEQTFVLELGDQYMRFHTLGSQILDSATTGTVSGATQADPVVVTDTAHPYSDGDEIYIAGVVGMTELNGRNFIIANSTANTYELQSVLTGADVDGTGYTAYSSGGTTSKVYEIATPWAAADLFELKYAQSGDVMTLVHPDYTPRDLVRVDNDTWTLTEAAFEPEQVAAGLIIGTVNTAVTSVAITAITQANPGVITTGAVHGLSVGDRVSVSGVNGMVEINNFEYEVTAVPSTTTLRVAFVGDPTNEIDTSGFTAYSSSGTLTTSVRPRKYTVTAVNEDDDEESLTGTDALPITITNVTQADPAVVTTAEGHGFSTGDEVVITGVTGMTELNGERFKITRTGSTSFSLRFVDGTSVDSTGFAAYTAFGTVVKDYVVLFASADAEWNNTLTWSPIVGAKAYNVYATDNLGVFGFVGSTEGLRFEDRNLAPDYAVTPPRLFNPFNSLVSATDKQPGAIGFFGQRRWLANSNDNPNRFWASQIGHFNNLSRSVPPLSDQAIVASIAARRINAINHIVPLTDLILLTSGGEYRIEGGQDGAITPSVINVRPQSYYGSTSLRPIVAGDLALFVSPGEFVRDLSYQFSDDKFIGKDVTILARHLFDYRTIVDWDYAPAPRALGFVVMSDGGACFLTYQPDQDIYAWTRSATNGLYKSTCVIRESGNDVIYMLVERIIAGNTVTYLERLDEHKFETLEDAFCVDAGLSLDAQLGGGVSSITAADPVVVTTNSAHGLSNGDYVDISGVVEVNTDVNEGVAKSADYNGTGFEVANVTATTFELQIEGSDYDGSAFAAYSSGGIVREAVTTVSGLWHLEGATVVAAGNGYSEKGLTVSNGSVTLTARASRIHVGLGYFCRLTTLPLTRYADGQTTDGKAKNINRLTVQVERTMGMWFGPDTSQMREANFGLPALYGQPLAMVTDDIDVTMKPDWGKRKQVVIEQRDPLPLTVLTLIPDTRLGGN